MKTYITWISDKKPAKRHLLGNKAYHLKKLYRRHVPTPNGLILTTHAFTESYQGGTTFNIPKHIKQHLDLSLQEFTNISPPPYIVRSSYTLEDGKAHSFAGIFESHIVSDPKKIINACIKVWQSTFSDQAQAYAKTINADLDGHMAVIIQPLVHAKKSGVLFNPNPIDPSDNNVLIEVVNGLNLPVTDGSSTPAQVIVNPHSVEIVSIVAGSQDAIVSIKHTKTQTSPTNLEPSLTREELLALTGIAARAREIITTPVDMEWAITAKGPQILQIRPQVSSSKEPPKNSSAPAILYGLPVYPGYITGNVKFLSDTNHLGIHKHHILVASIITPNHAAAIKKAGGVISAESSMYDTGPLLAKQLRIPMMIKPNRLLSSLRNNQQITLNTKTGEVYEGNVALKPLSLPSGVTHLNQLSSSTKIYAYHKDLFHQSALIAKQVAGVGVVSGSDIEQALFLHKASSGSSQQSTSAITSLLESLLVASAKKPIIIQLPKIKSLANVVIKVANRIKSSSSMTLLIPQLIDHKHIPQMVKNHTISFGISIIFPFQLHAFSSIHHPSIKAVAVDVSTYLSVSTGNHAHKLTIKSARDYIQSIIIKLAAIQHHYHIPTYLHNIPQEHFEHTIKTAAKNDIYSCAVLAHQIESAKIAAFV